MLIKCKTRIHIFAPRYALKFNNAFTEIVYIFAIESSTISEKLIIHSGNIFNHTNDYNNFECTSDSNLFWISNTTFEWNLDTYGIHFNQYMITYIIILVQTPINTLCFNWWFVLVCQTAFTFVVTGFVCLVFNSMSNSPNTILSTPFWNPTFAQNYKVDTQIHPLFKAATSVIANAWDWTPTLGIISTS